MASKKLAQSLLRYTSTHARIVTTASRSGSVRPQQNVTYRYLHTTQRVFADATPASAPAQAITTPKAEPPPDQDPEPAKHASFLGEADSNDTHEAYRDAYGDPPPSLDATNSAYLGEADSDDAFESRKDVDGEKLEAVDATNAAFLGEADSDDGFVSHRDAHPEDGDHKIENPIESGLHGQSGEGDHALEDK